MFGVEPLYIEHTDRKGNVVKRSKVKVSRIASLSKDLALALAAAPIRIEAPVPGRGYVGIEVPNSHTSLVSLRSIMESPEFQELEGELRIGLGQDVSGVAAVADLAQMPHLLVAGATGSGKSVCINAIIACLLTQHTPDTLRLLMIDPKMVELSLFNGIPHLIAPVVTDVDAAVTVLAWAVREMERRYRLLHKAGVRNISRFNQIAEKKNAPTLPYIVIFVDELADLMIAAPEEVERSITRLAQMARATGIHLVVATQRPSVDVVTGLIKANFPARIAFAVTSQIDSRVILDTPGAETLLGRGDMLFMKPDSSKLARLQGSYVSDAELNRLVGHWKSQNITSGAPAIVEQTAISTAEPQHAGEAEIETGAITSGTPVQHLLFEEMQAEVESARRRDDLFDEAVRVVREANRASVSLLQRRLRIGYSRAARLIDMMEEEGIVGPDLGGSLGRKVFSAKDGQKVPHEQENS